jgi:serine protease Do
LAFPFPPPSGPDQERLFPIKDPFGLRRVVTPLFLAPLVEKSLIGIGTSFFIAPDTVQLTAMHNITDVINQRVCAGYREGDLLTLENASLGILHDPGLVYGTVIAGTYLSITKIFFFPDKREDPLQVVRPAQRIEEVEIGLDAARLHFSRPPSVPVSLPIDFGHRRPLLQRGARVMAVGYKDIKGARSRFDAARDRLIIPMREEMWGSVGTVTGLYPDRGPGHNRWPTIEVNCDWPSGLSGGPIFSEDGFVVGIVSRSGIGVGCGVWLQRINPGIGVSSTLNLTSIVLTAFE